MSWRSKTYDELPALSIRRLELRRSLRIVTAGWMFGVVWMALVCGDQTRILGNMLGMEDSHFSILTGLTFLAAVGQFLAVFLIERTGLRKYQFMDFAAIGRLLWLGVAAIPLAFTLPSPAAIATMMVILFASSFCDALATPAWFSWMAQLIPRRLRGRYFAVRSRYTQYVQIVTVIVAGAVLDHMTAPHARDAPLTAQTQPALLWTVSILFAVAAAFGVTDILLFRGIRDVLPTLRQRPRTAAPSFGMLLEPLKDRVFRHYVLFYATILFSNALGGWFYWKNCRENLGFNSLATMVLFLALHPLIGILCAGWWGRIIDRWGRRPVLFVGGVGVVLTVVPYLIASPLIGTPAFLVDAINAVARLIGGAINGGARLFGAGSDLVSLAWVNSHTPVGSYLIILSSVVVGGIAWTGVNLAQTSIVLGFAEGQGRSNYVAAFWFFVNMGGLLGAGVAAVITHYLNWMHDSPIRLGPFLWNGWHVMFLLVTGARAFSLFWLKGMPDPSPGSVGNLLRYVWTSFSGNLANAVSFPLRVFGWKPSSEGRNREARD